MNTIETFTSLLTTIFSHVWRFFAETDVPFLGIKFSVFWVAVAAVSVLLFVIKFWFFGVVSHSDDIASRGGGSGGYKQYNRRG